MKRILRIIIILFSVGILSPGCTEKVPQNTSRRTEKPVIYTALYPAQYFAQRIVGDLAHVVCPVPENEDAIFWMPDNETIEAYQRADLVIINGASFSKWVTKVSLYQNRVVNTAKPFENKFINFEHAAIHSHGKEGDYAHEGLDGHTWLDPVNARIQANEICQSLVKMFPEHKTIFEKGYKALANDLDALDRTLKEYKERYDNKPLLTSHPAYNYIARRYGWNIKNLDLDPEALPSNKALQTIKETLQAHPAKYLIWETSPDKTVAEYIRKELGLASIVFSPCELLSDKDLTTGKDYITVMRANLRNISVIFD